VERSDEAEVCYQFPTRGQWSIKHFNTHLSYINVTRSATTPITLTFYITCNCLLIMSVQWSDRKAAYNVFIVTDDHSACPTVTSYHSGPSWTLGWGRGRARVCGVYGFCPWFLKFEPEFIKDQMLTTRSVLMQFQLLQSWYIWKYRYRSTLSSKTQENTRLHLFYLTVIVQNIWSIQWFIYGTFFRNTVCVLQTVCSYKVNIIKNSNILDN